MGEFSKRFVPPDGSDKPKVYVVGEAPGEEEDQKKIPFIGKSGKLLREALGKVTKLSRVRIFNAVPYRPINEFGKNRTPSHAEIDKYSKFLKKDIEETQPKVILCVGWAALYALCEYEGSIRDAMGRRFEYNGIPVKSVWHPSFLLRQGGKRAPIYNKWVTMLKDACGSSSHKDKDTGFKYEVFHWSKVDEFLEKFRDTKNTGYDVEGNSLEPLSVGFELAGFSLARKDYSAYLEFKCFENYDDYPDKKTLRKLGKFLEEKQEDGIVVFNATYEVPASLAVMGVELMHLKDSMQHGRVVNVTGKLKEIAITELGERDWRDELDEWKEELDFLQNLLKNRNRKGSSYPCKEMEVIHSEGMLALWKQQKELIDTTVERWENKRPAKLYACIKALRKIALASGISKPVFWKSLKKVILENQKQGRTSSVYTQIPLQIVSKYCCLDSFNTRRLYYHLRPILKEQEPEHDLLKAADYFDEHKYLAYELELNGICWDDREAERIDETYSRKAVDTLRDLILLPHVSAHLELTKQNIIDIQATTDLKVLKGFYNPNSTHATARVKFQELVISRRMKCALLFNKINGLLLSNEKETKRDMPYLAALVEQSLAVTHKDLGPLEKQKKKLKILDEFRNNLGEFLNRKASRNERYWTQNYANFELESMDNEGLLELYLAVRDFMGINIDDPKTYTQEASFLMLYRLYKKLDKATGTYIWGSPGRKSVRVVDKKAMRRGDRVILRSEYTSDIDRKEQAHLFCTSFNPNVAATKRWTATAHTIPSNAELRNIQVSRFLNGLLIKWDGSQIELLMVAVLAGEKAIIDAYSAGKDIHRFVAAGVFKVTEEQVTKAQRKHAKLVSFGILYGSSIKSVADGFMNGDMAAATHLFNSFFRLFPKVKIWIEEQHRKVKEVGYVNTIFGDRIIIPYESGDEYAEAAAMRQGQNYPVQGSASLIAGMAIARISRWIREKQFLTKLTCYTHDSSDSDSPPQEVLPMLEQVPKIAEASVKKDWNTPLRIDFEIGVRGNKMVKLEKINGEPLVTKTAKGGLVLAAEFEGEKSSVIDLKSRLGKFCKDVKIEVKESEDMYTSWGELFELKRAYTPEIGKTITKHKGIIIARAA